MAAMSGPREIVTLGVAVLCLTLAGCSTEQPANSVLNSADVQAIGQQLREQGLDYQASVLEDGVVTTEEYETAFDDLRSCVEKNGIRIDGPEINPLTGKTFEFEYDIAGLSDATSETILEGCETPYWGELSGIYYDTVQKEPDQQLLRRITACMSSAGLEVTEGTQDFWALFDRYDEKSASIASDCATTSVEELFPDLIAFSLGI